jgi:exodeoxyribonuclease VII large subunit
MTRPFDPDLISEPETPAAYTVSEINALAQKVLERNFRSVWVVGEISNLHLHRSGHIYFTLKDEQSQLDAVMWRTSAAALTFDLEDGMEVLAHGDLTIYARGGRYQLVARKIEPRGLGALEVAFRQLKERLEKEGLFDEAAKKTLPFLPRRIALVTSPQGAAVRDMLKGIFNRFPRTRVSLLPVKVQGEGAAAEIAEAIGALNRAGGFDVIVVGRGGGSLEDLWAFNEETVARAIFASAIPVVSAVGHERDVTISDLVAGVRAMPPTDAGRLVVPEERELRERLEVLRNSLVNALGRALEKARERLAYAWRHPILRRPEALLLPLAQGLDIAYDGFRRGVEAVLEQKRSRLGKVLVALESLSPLGVLSRGYSVTRDASGKVLSAAEQVLPGDTVETILNRGRLWSQVSEILPSGDSSDGEEEKGDV